MKLLTLVYDADLEDQITSVFQRSMAVTRYTKIEGVVGARMDALAESDYATDRRNNMVLVVADEETMELIVRELRALRDQVGHGMRGVVTRAEALI
ncbi:MAG TPA: hypothetical protein PLU39_10325 [Armatimonadota bacterium]|nr:hypothetical protein [Armatimonadota bacterium]HOJ21102.1 hypothetical protein [Armatimonadota bacterium]HOM83262.1 hypothetical protein [Armatimonadota bacterium]HOQ29512.1 hypothetical protein [Armatimonadota bacterium]HPO73163.1 hypothetical protein [Armatimonadota bacterium]